MKALVFGVKPDPFSTPAGASQLVKNLASSPVALRDVPRSTPLRPDWVVLEPRLVGICGSDSKQVLLDWGAGETADNPMMPFTSFPQIMGHEVVADVVELGPEAEGVEIGQRVSFTPWLTCEPRGVSPVCPACETGDDSLCWSFEEGPIAPGIHTGTSRDATGGYAEFMPAHTSMIFAVPDNVTDESAIFADPFAVSLHSVTRHPPPEGGKALVYGAGSLGLAAVSILRLLHPDVEVAVIARFEHQAAAATRLGAAKVVAHEPLDAILEELATWSGGRLRRTDRGLPMAHPGGIDVVYDTVGKPETFEVSTRLLKARGTLVKSGVNAPARWEWTPLYFKELTWVGSNAFGTEVMRGIRKHGIQHYLDLASAGEVDLTSMLTHTFRLEDWRNAFLTIADQGETGAIKVAIDHR